MKSLKATEDACWDMNGRINTMQTDVCNRVMTTQRKVDAVAQSAQAWNTGGGTSSADTSPQDTVSAAGVPRRDPAADDTGGNTLGTCAGAGKQFGECSLQAEGTLSKLAATRPKAPCQQCQRRNFLQKLALDLHRLCPLVQWGRAGQHAGHDRAHARYVCRRLFRSCSMCMSLGAGWRAGLPRRADPGTRPRLCQAIWLR